MQKIDARLPAVTARQNSRPATTVPRRAWDLPFPHKSLTQAAIVLGVFKNTSCWVLVHTSISTAEFNMDTMDTLAAPDAYKRASETAAYVRSQLPESLQNPKIAIVCGSGLGGLAETIEAEPKVQLAYSTIPNFPQSTGEWTSWSHCLSIAGAKGPDH